MGYYQIFTLSIQTPYLITVLVIKYVSGSAVQLGIHLTADLGLTSSTVLTVQLCQTTFFEIVHEIISMVILPLLLIQEGQLSVTCKNICTKYWLTAWRTKPAQGKCE